MITIAAEKDIDKIMGLIRDCVRDLEAHGVYQWGEHYPTREIIRGDIDSKSMHMLGEGGEILGIITLNEEQPLEWRKIRWSTEEGRILAVHRFAVSPRWQKQGIGRLLLDFAEEYAMNKGYSSIRLDAYSGNPRAIEIYEKHQYKRVGQICLPWRNLRAYCYEKILQ
jgi:ribosomal protein S18 acetylase RimI-like enzyme